MNPEIRKAIAFAIDGNDVPSDQMERAVGALMDGQCSEIEIAALLTALRVKGEAVAEIVGAATAMQRRCTSIPTSQGGLLDTCGTGGDCLHTYNISTATALVVAAAGVPVAKHGNRSVSSSSGSADVLEALGVNVELTPEQVSRCLEEVGIGFCFAPLLHGAMKHVAPVRKQLEFRTIFNLLGPLTNPAAACYQLLGANRQDTARKLAQSLARLSRTKAIVVCGGDQLDEVSLWGETAVFIVAEDAVSETVWTSDTFGLPECRVEDLQVDSAAASADVIRNVFAGNAGPARNILLANTAAALLAAERCETPETAMQLAIETINAGHAKDLLTRLVTFTSKERTNHTSE